MTPDSQILQLAVQYHRANRLTEAEQSYRQVLEQQPQHPEALYGLGMLAQQVGKPQIAEELLSTAVEVQPEFLKAWFSLGNVRQAQGKLLEAESAYQKAIALKPDIAPLYNNLGYTLQQQGKWEEAIACYQKALLIQPECTEADVNWGNALHAQGKLSPEQQAHYAQLNNKLGVARQKAGDLKTALAYYRQVIALQPDLVDAHYNLGVVLQEQGEIEEAIACFHQVLKLDPGNGEAYIHLGKIYQKQNQLQEAAAAYRRGLKSINPHYAKAVEAYKESEMAEKNYQSPQLCLEEVTVGGHQFPAIPPVPDGEGKRPFWSVIIPLYNRKEYLLECLTSVLAQWQGEEEMEILVMDNASNPPLFELVNIIGGGIVRYYLNSENIGPRRNFNRGIALSRGQWIHLLPEDEYVLPGFYARLKEGLEGCPDSVGAAFTGYENINQKGQVIGQQHHHGMHRGINQEWLWRIGVSNWLNPCAVVIRRATHERLGGYDPGNHFTPDWELYKRIAAFCDWWYEPGILARYREHANNMTSEVFLAGAQGFQYRLGIEISESYLPPEITAKARSWYFQKCLEEAVILLKIGKISSAFRLVQETLKIDGSPQAAAKLFTWLTEEQAAPLRNEIVSKLLSLPWNDSDTPDSFYFAYP